MFLFKVRNHDAFEGLRTQTEAFETAMTLFAQQLHQQGIDFEEAWGKLELTKERIEVLQERILARDMKRVPEGNPDDD